MNERKDMRSSSEWFRTWFHTSYYDLLYEHRDEEEARDFVRRIYHKLEMHQGARVLDIPCGWGRHSFELHRLGLKVTGLDINPQLIARAHKKASEGIVFNIHDIRQTYDQGPFDYVLNLFTSIGYFSTDSENRAALRGLTSVLRKNGRILIDFLNADRLQMSFKPSEEQTIKGIRFRIRRSISDNYIRKEVDVEDQGKVHRFFEQVMLYGEKWFRDTLEALEMKVIGCYGDYYFTPFEPTQSERLLITAERR